MKRKSKVTIGPGADSLILIVVILSMSVLGMLALMNARNDHKLSARGISVVEAGYALNDRAERSLAALDGVLYSCRAVSNDDEAYLAAIRGLLPAGMLMDGRIVSWSESDELRTLNCAVEVLPLDGKARYQWRDHRLTAVTEEIWN